MKTMSNNRLNHIRPEILSMGAYHVPDASGLIKLDAMELVGTISVFCIIVRMKFTAQNMRTITR